MRLKSINLLRCTAIVIMIVVHFLENLSGIVPTISGFGATLFSFLSGVNYRLWLDSQHAQGVSEEMISVRTVRRGLFLVGAGITFNVLVWLPADTFNWDVLTFLGMGYLMLEWARRMRPGVVASACVVIFVISPAARVLVDYDSFWSSGQYDPDVTLSDVLSGFFATGYFPLLPWLCYPLLGFLVAGELFAVQTTQRRSLAWCAKFGAGLLATSLGALALRALWPTLAIGAAGRWFGGWTNYPASPEFVSGTLGVALLYFAAAQRWLDVPGAASWPRLETVTALYSRHAFTLYILHHIVHLWPLWWLAYSRAEEPTAYWQKALGAGPALALGLVFLVLSGPLLVWMERRRVRGIEDFMRWVCD